MKLTLAPMQGLADPIMRDVLTRIGGIDEAVTEFVRVTDTLLPTRTFMRLCPELESGGLTRGGVPVSVQLLGSEPGWLAENAVRAAALGAPAIDLNFGCPAPAVNRHRGGAVLLDEPELIHVIVKAVRDAVPAGTPVTAKMRLGYADTARAFDCAHAIEAAGADLLTVHARTKVEGYKPPAHWHWIARLREAVSLPVVANGEVWTVDDWRSIREQSGCDAVMVGRGLVADPGLAGEIHAASRGDEPVPLSWVVLLPWLEDFFAQCRAEAEHYAVARLKQWLGQLKRRHPEAEAFFARIRTLREADAVAETLASARREEEEGAAA
ncbi:tRNA dihydrouridine synthase [Crenobacter cavernae]|uniref:tRNA-dihydrouridine(16) synthase n=1 Tax=Crenobacter cavernae TaxID=2290923 RepID=A0ABY0FAG8_9NEIS|nr:tRNA-dihydrouridine synthase [Crenobacter cavernae]RXZ42642.1 tRNA-dihydrouridine synthase [Crenobacter cavernae]